MNKNFLGNGEKFPAGRFFSLPREKQFPAEKNFDNLNQTNSAKPARI